jgi:hypothetical protein
MLLESNPDAQIYLSFRRFFEPAIFPVFQVFGLQGFKNLAMPRGKGHKDEKDAASYRDLPPQR